MKTEGLHMGFEFIQGKKGSLNVVKVILPIILAFLYSCNTENAPDCFQDAGEIKRTEMVLGDFSKITVFEKISVVLKHGETQKVEIETGEYLFKDIVAEVEDDRLVLRNGNGCNFFREYGLTKVYITTPNITEIRSSTGLPIESDGPLRYASLVLFSESFTDPETETTDGSFDLELETGSVSVVVNGIVYIKLKGNTDNLNINIAAGDSRIDAENLVANSVSLNHRGTNDIQINPQQSLTGVIRGTGDVISYNRPPIVEIEELYTGKLVFKD